MRTHFETDGFLSDELSSFECQITDRYSVQLDLAREVNRIAQEMLGTLQIERDDLRGVLLGTLLTRQAESFQAFLILVSKGLLFQAQIILRNIAESMFVVGAISKDKTFAGDFILRDHMSRLKFAQALKRYHERKGSSNEDLDNLIKQLQITVKESQNEDGPKARGKRKTLRPFSTEQIARIAQMEDVYDNTYRRTSLAVHTLPTSLNETFVVDQNDEIEALKYEPRIDNLEIWLFSAIEMTLCTLREMTEHFSLHVSRSRIGQMTSRHKALFDAHEASTNFW